ncbi:ROK family protein [Paenibacillus sp. GXUN7292]|uniref:ROK family protein n=1 Tax=Paenibacillus sp. GXUN7292 TaxID=3422499 RepID=UPI003D7DE23B
METDGGSSLLKSKSTGDQALIKKINTSIVLESVLTHAPLSRAQISTLTGLNKATVSNLVQDLIDNHLVLEVGIGESSGGRKPVILHFNKNAGYAIGIDLGVNYIHGILTDLEGNVLIDRQQKLKLRDRDHIFHELSAFIEGLIKQVPESPYGLIGIGVGVPGIVDDNGIILLAPNLKWHQIELRKKLEERFALPVTIDNEANAGALGELKYGAGRDIANQVYVSVGIGIGTGLILNKELYTGASGFSGELGHMSIEYNGKLCSCGNQGCWELYASEQALLEQAAPLGYESLEDLLAATENNDEQVISLIKDAGAYLGAGIANIVNIFNPDLVIIGNRMVRAQKWLQEAVEESVAKRALPLHREKLKVQFAELQEQSAVRGAAYAAINNFFIKIKSE